MSQRNALLGDDMGCGKSMQALRALPRRGRTILVTMASIIPSWQDQIQNWRPDLVATVCEQKNDLRRPDEGETLLCSYDSLPDLRAHTTALIDEPLSDVHLLLDECQAAKSDDSLRSKKVRRLRIQCGWCWGLTATPMLGDPEDLWGVLVSVGLANIFEDRQTYVEMCGGKPRFIWDKRMNRGRGGLRRIGYNWGTVSPEVKERLHTVMLRRLADDVLDDLPEIESYDIPVKTPKDLVPFLTKVKDEWDLVGPGDLPPFELLSEGMAALARSKIPAALEQADLKAEHAPLLVFSAHVDPILAMKDLKGAAAFVGTESVKERARLIAKFQAGDLRILAMTIATGGTGLNLQHAGGVLFIDRNYDPTKEQQAFARARRQGNKRERVIRWRLVSQHPLDIHLNQILDRKIRLNSEIVG